MAFLPGENKKIDTARARDVSFDMMDFVEQVFNDEYALIVGSEVMLNPERVPMGGGDMNKYLISVINELQHTECADFNELIENELVVNGELKVYVSFKGESIKEMLDRIAES